MEETKKVIVNNQNINQLVEDKNRFEEELEGEKEVELFDFSSSIPNTSKSSFDKQQETLEIINKITEEIYDRDPEQLEYVKRLADFRGLKAENLIADKCFYVPKASYLEALFNDLPLFKDHLNIVTSKNTLFYQRLLIPVRDFYGKVYGFVGWDKFSEAKYVEYSADVYIKANLKVLGLDKIDTLLEKRYCIITEGVFDYYRGLENGLPMLPNLGISFNKKLKPILDRMDVVFTAYDNDKAGLKNQSTVESIHPNVYHILFEQKDKKIDFDEALKNPIVVEKLKKEIAKRVNQRYIKQKSIII